MPKFAVILAAAGRSSRFGTSHHKKPFVDLQGRPVWVRALEPFANHPDVVQSLVVVSPDDRDWFKEQFHSFLTQMHVELVAGGQERADSVQNALIHAREDVDFIAVHDAARPLITRTLIDAVFESALQTGAAIPACPISSTIKRVHNGAIRETVSRENLWGAQTPQVFDRQILLQAYAKRGSFVATDEAQLVERTGHAVAIVECSALNLKITTQTDLLLAEALLGVMPNHSTF